MPLTYKELQERLCEVEETALLELLGITSEDLVYAFGDLIEERTDELLSTFEEEQEQWYQ